MKKNEDTKVSKLIINTIDKRFDDSLKEFIKQRKQIKIDEKQTENKEKESIRDLNKTVFKGFTHGFYRKWPLIFWGISKRCKNLTSKQSSIMIYLL